MLKETKPTAWWLKIVIQHQYVNPRSAMALYSRIEHGSGINGICKASDRHVFLPGCYIHSLVPSPLSPVRLALHKGLVFLLKYTFRFFGKDARAI
ncbi:hypothetical protein MKW98_003638 [Papaver atlanticum]|uniref:Uncharacterized protein n=1 Tax=Papaver atlanticum TaxID=357466 RepID=A0AAD4SJ22_9MAGN|nr:hypothetical protein MKW98_003638 [Papaver atlanticum]